MDIREEPLTVDEMASYLKKSAYTVREHAKSGAIPAHKVGGTWRFFLSEFHAQRTAEVVDPFAAPRSRRRKS
ncbi:DNA binding domain-containing protein, excisionase family [Agromyces sp. CF514]|uniref:helix-turn-helix domain-containing protein n=1 Tax=Agromyces sp. CF514 TaxID=1881031 RepID=UPI0008F0E297|nr:DNA binding domain-containing protein, excisionase family [Agromyces sp. CF514]